MKDIWVYDLEILGGNFFCGTFINPFTKEKKVCYKLDGYSYNTDILYDFINNCLLIGYNNYMFDDILLNYIWEWKEVNTKELFALSTTIISQQRTGIPLWKNEDVKGYMNKRVESLDLMKILAFDKLKVSLKQCAINLRHDRIQDMPVAYDKYIFNEDLETILSYNENDVRITLSLLDNLKEAINLRFKISSDYKVNVKSASKTYIGKEILNKYYADYTSTLKEDFKSLRSGRVKIFLGNCIQSNISFKTEIMNRMLDYFKDQTVYSIEDSIDYKILYKGKGYQMGFGGLHSIDRPKIFQSTDNTDIIDADVDSYYPNVIINYKIKPEHCSDEFFTIVKDIVDVRIKAKKSKDKITAETLKITANAIFGLMNFENYWLYDPKAALSVTINGQLYLLMLIEALEENGFEVISANTDGVTTIVPKLRRDEYDKICRSWSSNTHFNLSFCKYIRYIRRDINNYSALQTDGEVKAKGIFFEKQLLEKGYNTSIIPKALNNYFLYYIPIDKTINECNDIFDFCKSEKSGSQFQMELHYIKGTDKKINILQKTNRYFIAKKGGTLLKRKGDALHNVQLGWQIYILNDYKEDKLQDYLTNVNRKYYINECNKILEIIEDKQLTLF